LAADAGREPDTLPLFDDRHETRDASVSRPSNISQIRGLVPWASPLEHVPTPRGSQKDSEVRISG
jgi:hypothetical protein